MRGFDAQMRQLGTERHELPAGTTSTVTLTGLTDSDRLAYVVVEPKGAVVGSATFRKDEGIAAMPLEVAPVPCALLGVGTPPRQPWRWL